jgi:MFS family permease
MNSSDINAALATNNIRQFIVFRAFFNARFYYPIFAILFLDFGLTLEHFALLNAVWAASIVLLEVPSGALADTFGRRNLLVCAGGLMVVEIALLCFVPLGNLNLLLVVFVINRVLSGAAEAAASGADEALAFDSLKKAGLSASWSRVLEKQMRFQSFLRMGAMIAGAAVYDPTLMQLVARGLGLQVTLSQEVTMRFPLYLTLVFAVVTFVTTLRMREVSVAGPTDQQPQDRSILQTFRLTLKAGRWILTTPFALVVIMTGLMFDSIIRMFSTMNSQYYRVIDVPEATFGLIAALLSFLGIFHAFIARKLVDNRSALFNMALLSVLALVGLTGVSLVIPIFGLLPMIFLSAVMYMLSFFTSYYLNRITSSDQRATVLSFKGLSFNLGYGLIGILYSLLLAFLRLRTDAPAAAAAGWGIEDFVYISSLSWFPWVFVCCLAVLVIFSRWKLKGLKKEELGKGI